MPEAKSDFDLQLDATGLSVQHETALDGMTEDQLVVVSREVLAVVIRMKARQNGQMVTRGESLAAVFRAEAQARAAGAKPRLDIFTPIDRDLPGEDLG